MTRWECYIEEYESENGLAARLRDKKTNKKIKILSTSLFSYLEEKAHLLRFLSAAKLYKDIMPTVFNRDGKDVVAVYGVKRKENKTTILVDIYRDGGGYLFE